MVSNYLLSCALNKIERNQISNRHYFHFSIVALKFDAFPHMKKYCKEKTNIYSFIFSETWILYVSKVYDLFYVGFELTVWTKSVVTNWFEIEYKLHYMYLLHYIYTGVILKFYSTPVKKSNIMVFCLMFIFYLLTHFHKYFITVSIIAWNVGNDVWRIDVNLDKATELNAATDCNFKHFKN